MWRATQERGENPLFPLERGELSEPEFLSILQAALSAELGRDVEMSGFAERYFAALEPNEEMIAFLASLRARGIRLAMLTNNVREWEARWRAMIPEIDATFEVIVDSAFVGMRKPDPEIYALTVERLGDGLRPEECLFVDDVEVNCDAAAALGMSVVHYTGNETAIPAISALA